MKMAKKVYLDNGATTQVDKLVIDAMLPYFNKKYGNPSSLHSFGREAKEAIEKSRKVIADSIGAETEEIIFTSGGTEADNLAIFGIAKQMKEKGKTHLITTNIEHPAVTNAFKELEKQGFDITFIKVDKEGFIDIKELEKKLNRKTCLVSVILANNEIGTIQNITKIGKLCKEKGILLHTDAVQAFTKFPINVNKMNISLLSMSSHKIHGPKGIGALFVRKNIDLQPTTFGGEQEKSRRAGTENVAGIVGFAKAAELAQDKKHVSKMAELRDYFIKQVETNIENVKLNGPKGNKRLCNNINLSFSYVEGEGILLHLDNFGIAVSTGSACSQISLKPSHVLEAIGLPHDIVHGSIRFTLSRFTTKEELDYTIKKLKQVITDLRKISPLVNR
jgi:cysteine desulfurase